ncbi:alpha-ketoglutarate-dependent dioxygenase AlkB family protein [Thalassomonas actiniarum]|uniref:Alpha-ketoglutarate-dependent dioxygenase AlkB n=1 Tax=Thalassomonas actiniarum TaxID=485447 RepID=A0AAE9YNW5_9GAMM|nr:alpha-ketoglutarate-dependent dioxygenase AlkB [Thalassomonas actiniarum]WDD98142.1 alpha-ketoglutarate-dependent dioxygenase AlkB [Thalassomonas actiniarum]
MIINITAPNADLQYFPAFIPMARSRLLYDELAQQLDWSQDSIVLYGKPVLIPRLQAWYGDDGLDYTYSGLTLAAKSWLPVLIQLKQMVEAKTGEQFNAVLANLYRDGNDTVGWHSDDEPELGENPVIASLSFGGERNFNLKHKISGEKLTVPLKSGSLLTMAGQTQRFWQHCLPRTKKAKLPRINLTFRQIKS